MKNFKAIEQWGEDGEVKEEALIVTDDQMTGEDFDIHQINDSNGQAIRNCCINFAPLFFYTGGLEIKMLFLN